MKYPEIMERDEICYYFENRPRDMILVHVQTKDNHLRDFLDQNGYYWEEIIDCFPWIQIELPLSALFHILLQFKIQLLEILD